MTRNEFNLLLAIKNLGMPGYRSLASQAGTSLGYVSKAVKAFTQNGYIDSEGITAEGLAALAPYKVKNAVIMAAGMSSRFVPLSLEKPKGLLVVKNEVLIERQIEQLHEAGIKDIVVVLGYKKEAFFYLQEKYGVKIIINPQFNTKNNIETLYLAREHIGNSYICSSDDYFEENVFADYVYQSYYSAIHVNEKSNEWYMIPDAKGNVAQVRKSGTEGDVMLGHVYWDRAFAQAFIKLICLHHDLGDYDANLWEDLFADNIKALPPMEIKVYPDNVIFEFDSLEELRKFDTYYVNNTHSKIMKNICKVFDCRQGDILDFAAIKEGLTNSSFVFSVFGKKYVYRHPGDGTGAIISRAHEKRALEIARELDIDPTFIYMDAEEGWKISHFIEGVRVPDYSCFEDSKRVIAVMRQLHEKKYSVDWSFLPWEDALKIEELLRAKGEIMVKNFDRLKDNIRRCYEKTRGDGVEMCFCHCDTYAPNWILSGDNTVLIDWEYAGNADPGCDIGAYVMDAMYEVDEAISFIREYCGDKCSDALIFHHLSYIALVAYYWFVWALYREACGAVMGESLHNWYVMAVKYSNYLTSNM